MKKCYEVLAIQEKVRDIAAIMDCIIHDGFVRLPYADEAKIGELQALIKELIEIGRE